jgi:predicted transcriptional regulator
MTSRFPLGDHRETEIELAFPGEGNNMAIKRRKVGEREGRGARNISKAKGMVELKTVPDYKWDEAREFIDRNWDNPADDDKTIVILSEQELQAIATKERLRIIRLLRTVKAKSINEIAARLGRDQASVSRDLAVLERTGIIRKVRSGKTVRIEMRADMVLLPIIEKDLFQMLGHSKTGRSKGPVDTTVETLEQLMVLSLLYEKIFPRLDAGMRDQRKLTFMLTEWVLQELKELPDRLVRRLHSMPKEYWEERIKRKDYQRSVQG